MLSTVGWAGCAGGEPQTSPHATFQLPFLELMWGQSLFGLTGCRPRWTRSSVLRGTLTTRTWGGCSTCPRCGDGRGASGQMWVIHRVQPAASLNPLVQGVPNSTAQEGNPLGDQKSFPYPGSSQTNDMGVAGGGTQAAAWKGFAGNANVQPGLVTSPRGNVPGLPFPARPGAQAFSFPRGSQAQQTPPLAVKA